MKFSEIPEIKNKIMVALNKSVNEMLDQLQANELAMAGAKGDGNIDLEVGYFNAELVMDFPQYHGSNGEGFKIFCSPSVKIKPDFYLDEDLVKSKTKK